MIFVHKDFREPETIRVTDFRMIPKEPHRLHLQILEIKHAEGLELVLILLENRVQILEGNRIEAGHLQLGQGF